MDNRVIHERSPQVSEWSQRSLFSGVVEMSKSYASDEELKQVDDLFAAGHYRGALALCEQLFKEEQENHARDVREAEERYKWSYANPNVEDMYAGMDLAVAADAPKNSKDVLERLAKARANVNK